MSVVCHTPFILTTVDPPIPVPCGKCPQCKRRRVDNWVFRLLQEEKRATSAYFVTLTYATQTVPISDNGFMTLRKSDVQNYMKRLRKRCLGANIKYYAAGEYGSKRKRPHYHIIVFNCPSDFDLREAWSLDGSPIGEVHIGTCTGDSIAYCMKYIDKSTWKSGHSRDDRVPEFSLMSKGLGECFLTDEVRRYYKEDLSRMFVVYKGGYRKSMPRYYRKKLYDDQDLADQRVIVDRAVAAQNAADTDRYYRLYPGIDIYTINDIRRSNRWLLNHNFYNKLKPRNHD